MIRHHRRRHLIWNFRYPAKNVSAAAGLAISGTKRSCDLRYSAWDFVSFELQFYFQGPSYWTPPPNLQFQGTQWLDVAESAIPGTKGEPEIAGTVETVASEISSYRIYKHTLCKGTWELELLAEVVRALYSQLDVMRICICQKMPWNQGLWST